MSTSFTCWWRSVLPAQRHNIVPIAQKQRCLITFHHLLAVIHGPRVFSSKESTAEVQGRHQQLSRGTWKCSWWCLKTKNASHRQIRFHFALYCLLPPILSHLIKSDNVSRHSVVKLEASKVASRRVKLRWFWSVGKGPNADCLPVETRPRSPRQPFGLLITLVHVAGMFTCAIPNFQAKLLACS